MSNITVIIASFRPSIAATVMSNKQKAFDSVPFLTQSGDGHRLFDDDQRIRIINEVCKKYPTCFQDINKMHLMYASSLWIPRERCYLTIVRVYQFDFSSVLYLTTHSEDNWKEGLRRFRIGSFYGPGILPIPIDMSVWQNKGPEDPRIFRNEHGDICIVFNMHSEGKRRIHLFNLKTEKLTKFDSSVLPQGQIQKNWAPIKIAGKFYYVYSYTPLRLMDCSDSGNCTIVAGSPVDNFGALRPGTPFIEVIEGIYLGFIFIHSSKHYYRPILSVLRVDSGNPKTLRQIYRTGILKFTNSAFSNARIMIASSIPRIDFERNFIEVTVFFEDKDCYAFRLSGIKEFLQQAIKNGI